MYMSILEVTTFIAFFLSLDAKQYSLQVKKMFTFIQITNCRKTQKRKSKYLNFYANNVLFPKKSIGWK